MSHPGILVCVISRIGNQMASKLICSRLTESLSRGFYSTKKWPAEFSKKIIQKNGSSLLSPSPRPLFYLLQCRKSAVMTSLCSAEPLAGLWAKAICRLFVAVTSASTGTRYCPRFSPQSSRMWTCLWMCWRCAVGQKWGLSMFLLWSKSNTWNTTFLVQL